MRAAIIAVGTELLVGNTVNTNAANLSAFLHNHGIRVLYHVTVGDNPERLSEVVQAYLSKVDLLITTGGLGPTQDDLTREIVCKAMNIPLVLDKTIEADLDHFFRSIGKEMTENNRKQAMRPVNSVVIDNPRGTAPGLIVEKDQKRVVLLPGPPREIEPMLQGAVHDYLQAVQEEVISSVYLRVAGMGESSIDNALSDLMGSQNPTIAPYVKSGSVALRITASGKTEATCNEMIAPLVEKVVQRLGDAVYAQEDISLEEAVGRLLIQHGISVSTAESCTGGRIASKLTDVSGISSVFDRGFVTYSNQAKIEELNVQATTLDKYGAVSRETAEEMAEGLSRISHSDIALSVTGIAGPTGGSDEKPVGLVYMGVCVRGETEVHAFQFSGDRDRVRRYAVINGLLLIRNAAKKLTLE